MCIHLLSDVNLPFFNYNILQFLLLQFFKINFLRFEYVGVILYPLIFKDYLIGNTILGKISANNN